MRRHLVLLSIGSAALLGSPALAQTGPGPSSITVQGEANAELTPDAAQVAVGIEADRTTANAATAEVARAAQAVSEAIRADGIADGDVRTTTVGLSPVYPEDSLPVAGRARLPQTFRAATTFVVTVRPPERAGLVLAHLVDKGATTIEGIVFTSTAEAHTRDTLRADATREARRRADIYVQALGLHLGDVQMITPEESGSVAPMAFTRASKSIMAAPTPALPVVPGPLQLREAVAVRWAIAP